jgi:hypothetical protein
MKAFGLLIGAGVLALAAGQADATVSLYAQTSGTNGGAITYLGSDNGAGGLNYSGNYGTFYNSVSAVGAPALPSPTLLSQTINVSGNTAGLLSLFIVQSGVVGSPLNLLSTFTANAFTGAVNSVVESSFASQANPFTLSATGGYNFAASQLATHAFTGIGTFQSTNSVSGITGPYYEVARYDVTFGNGGGSANNTINLQSGVPEPGTWAMALCGFGFMGFALRQRRRTNVSFG